MYTIRFDSRVKTEDWPKLPKTMQNRIRKAIETRLAIDPINLGKPLKHDLSGCRRLRVGDYRIIYLIKADMTEILVLAIAHRQFVYDP